MLARALGLVALAGGIAGSALAADTDGDGVADFRDNCLVEPNPTQLDTNRDGFGNRCDPDYDGDGLVGSAEWISLQQALGSENRDLDLTGDGRVTSTDAYRFLIYLGRAPGPSGLSCAGGVPCCGAPLLRAPEEVLDGAVALSWSAGNAFGFEIEKRIGSAWATIGRLGAAERSFVDESARVGGNEYRIRASCSAAGESAVYSDYSERAFFTLRNACAGQPGFDPALPVVPIADLDHNGRYTGADVALALNQCSALGGCVLEALPETYDDVAISIRDLPRICGPEFSQCFEGTLTFPRGLVIQGHGRRSVLRSPLWPPGYDKPQPLLELWARPDIRIRLRNLVLDGRKAEQRDAVQAPAGWRHYGFSSSNWNKWSDHSQRNTNGCLHGVTVRNFFNMGVHIADAARWIVEDSTVEDMGCLEGVTHCSLDGFLDDPNPVAGYGIYAAGYNDDLVVRRNQVRRVGKYSIGLKAGSDGMTGLLQRAVVLGNRITEAGSIGIFAAGLIDSTIAGNVVDSTHRPGSRAYSYDTFGLSFRALMTGTWVAANQVLNSAGIGLSWKVQGTGNILYANVIRGSCREKNPTVCAPGSDGKPACYLYTDIDVWNPEGALRLEGNVVQDTLCAAALGITGGAVVNDGYYAGGANSPVTAAFSSVSVTLQGGATFEGSPAGHCLHFRNTAEGPTRGVLTSSVELAGCGSPYRVDLGSSVLDCSAEPQRCAAICSGPSPPGWCGF
jgi:hypothetical protein